MTPFWGQWNYDPEQYGRGIGPNEAKASSAGSDSIWGGGFVQSYDRQKSSTSWYLSPYLATPYVCQSSRIFRLLYSISPSLVKELKDLAKILGPLQKPPPERGGWYQVGIT